MIFVSLDSPEMQAYFDSLTSEDDPFELVAAQEEADGCPLVVPNQSIN